MNLYNKEGIIHYPSLKTMLMIEEVLRTAHGKLKREELKKKLEKKIMHQTLNAALKYMSERKLISDSRAGIEWIFSANPMLKKNVHIHKHVGYAY